jgi:hypothetical protein
MSLNWVWDVDQSQGKLHTLASYGYHESNITYISKLVEGYLGKLKKLEHMIPCNKQVLHLYPIKEDLRNIFIKLVLIIPT